MLSDKIKKYREDNKLTQNELADKLYVSRSAVAKWEQGKGIPSKSSLGDVATLLNSTINDLLDDDTTYEVIDNLKISSKKQSIYFIISIIIIIGLIFSYTLFIVLDNAPIDVVTSPDGKYTLKVYDYLEEDKFSIQKDKGFHYKYYYEGEYMNSIRSVEGCEYASITFSPTSSCFIMAYYYYDDNNERKIFHELSNLKMNFSANVQLLINYEIIKYYEIEDYLTYKDIDLKLICFSTDADMVLMQYSFYSNNELVNGYLWFDVVTYQALGITEIPNIE